MLTRPLVAGIAMPIRIGNLIISASDSGVLLDGIFIIS